MEYHGKLYGKVGKKYFDTGKSSYDFDKLKTKNKEANEFIIEIAKMLKIETDGVGYDDIQLSLDDFLDAINILNNDK